mmetsp:Transcript_75568/g.213790  ORF Transcript_75568/g.213790 Transcript_75568/m.213790 type:complete len:509 (+) Transcript_75568:914-2440(+)
MLHRASPDHQRGLGVRTFLRLDNKEAVLDSELEAVEVHPLDVLFPSNYAAQALEEPPMMPGLRITAERAADHHHDLPSGCELRQEQLHQSVVAGHDQVKAWALLGPSRGTERAISMAMLHFARHWSLRLGKPLWQGCLAPCVKDPEGFRPGAPVADHLADGILKAALRSLLRIVHGNHELVKPRQLWDKGNDVQPPHPILELLRPLLCLGILAEAVAQEGTLAHAVETVRREWHAVPSYVDQVKVPGIVDDAVVRLEVLETPSHVPPAVQELDQLAAMSPTVQASSDVAALQHVLGEYCDTWEVLQAGRNAGIKNLEGIVQDFEDHALCPHPDQLNICNSAGMWEETACLLGPQLSQSCCERCHLAHIDVHMELIWLWPPFSELHHVLLDHVDDLHVPLLRRHDIVKLRRKLPQARLIMQEAFEHTMQSSDPCERAVESSEAVVHERLPRLARLTAQDRTAHLQNNDFAHLVRRRDNIVDILVDNRKLGPHICGPSQRAPVVLDKERV